jgi:nicotinate-nucleotide adenylyltransferase
VKSGIAIYGGTFDPPHNGHARVVSNICSLPFIDKLKITITWAPPYKKPMASFYDRYRMTSNAFSGISNKIEVLYEKFKYTSTLLRWLRRETKEPIYFFTGFDWDLDSFHDAADVKTRCIQVKVSDGREEFFPSGIRNNKGLVFGFDKPINIHSTTIREMLSRHKPIDGLVPQDVVKYINGKKPYKFL